MTKDSKKIWDHIDWNGNCKKDAFEIYPEIDDLAAQFKSKDTIYEENLRCLDFGNNSVPVLDNEVSIDEIQEASQLKEGKSTADGWTPKMITEVSSMLFPILQIIFNVILRCSVFPRRWWENVVVALFKQKGSREVPKNFRPVSLVVMLSKVFDFILLHRFKKWFKPRDLFLVPIFLRI